MGNLLKYASLIFQLAPVVIQAVEQIGQAAKLPGTTKKDLATQSLMLASGVAQVVDPGDTETIQAAQQIAGTAIELTGAATGLFKHSPTVTPTAETSPGITVLHPGDPGY